MKCRLKYRARVSLLNAWNAFNQSISFLFSVPNPSNQPPPPPPHLVQSFFQPHLICFQSADDFLMILLTQMCREVRGPIEKSSRSSPNGFLIALATWKSNGIYVCQKSLLWIKKKTPQNSRIFFSQMSKKCQNWILCSNKNIIWPFKSCENFNDTWKNQKYLHWNYSKLHEA